MIISFIWYETWSNTCFQTRGFIIWMFGTWICRFCRKMMFICQSLSSKRNCICYSHMFVLRCAVNSMWCATPTVRANSQNKSAIWLSGKHTKVMIQSLFRFWRLVYRLTNRTLIDYSSYICMWTYIILDVISRQNWEHMLQAGEHILIRNYILPHVVFNLQTLTDKMNVWSHW